jgi:hypothetical protein
MLCGCAGNMERMTTYRGAAKSFSNDYCGQFCWSSHQPTSADEISGEDVCHDTLAASSLGQCAKDLAAKKHFVDKKEARAELEQCMQTKGWRLVTAYVVICE